MECKMNGKSFYAKIKEISFGSLKALIVGAVIISLILYLGGIRLFGVIVSIAALVAISVIIIWASIALLKKIQWRAKMGKLVGLVKRDIHHYSVYEITFPVFFGAEVAGSIPFTTYENFFFALPITLGFYFVFIGAKEFPMALFLTAVGFTATLPTVVWCLW